MKKSFTIWLIPNLLLGSCTPYIYIPNASNIPLSYSKNEIKAGGGVSTSGLYLEGSYALGGHIVVLGNFCDETGADSAINNAGSNIFGEIGGGYYGSIKKGCRFEIIGGYGIGNVSNNDYVEPLYFGIRPPFRHYVVNNHYGRAMLQTDMGLFSKNAEMGLSLKLSYLAMPDAYYHVSNYDSSTKVDYDTTSLSIPNHALFIEPALFLNLGLKHVKFHVCYGFTYLLD